MLPRERVLREFQKLGEDLTYSEGVLKGSVDELRKDVYGKLAPKK